MAIYINKDTNVLVQGITGNQGSFHTKQMIAYGTKVVAGVSPGKGGQNVDGIPVYDSVAAAVENHKIDATILSPVGFIFCIPPLMSRVRR